MSSVNSLTSWTHGLRGLLLAYGIVLVAMLVALIKRRAPLAKFPSAVMGAVVVMVIAGIVATIVHSLLSGFGLADEGLLQVLIASGIHAAVGYWGGVAVAQSAESGRAAGRGAVVAEREAAIRRGAGRRGAWGRNAERARDAVTLAGVALSPDDEVKHFKLIGTTGTGKTTAIREMLCAVLVRGDRAVIADPDGGYLKHFYDAARGDVILNPFEPDALKWNLLGEIGAAYDIDQLAASLIPAGEGRDRVWSDYGRTFFIAVVQQALAGRVTDDREIFRLISEAPVSELKVLLAGTMAGPFISESNDRMFDSIRSVTVSAVRALRYTTQQQAAPFSVRQWVREGGSKRGGGKGGVLFLPYKATEIAALKDTISAWMRLAIFEAMNREEGDQGLWFVVDELDALGEIDGLKDALARLRKFGGRCVLGLQSISQVSGTYGKSTAATIVENCGNTLILRCSASEQGGTSQFASRLIGQQEVVHTSQSRTRRPGEFFASTTTSEHRSVEPAIMASEIERLADLAGYLKIASIPDWMRVRLEPKNLPSVERPKRPAPAPLLGVVSGTAVGAPAAVAVAAAPPVRKKPGPKPKATKAVP